MGGAGRVGHASAHMPRIINSTYITLDGVVEGPQLWPSNGRPGDQRAGEIQSELLLSCHAVLMGRRTYEGFAEVWPARTGDPIADRINAMPKFVVSTTLEDPAWSNTHVIGDHVEGAVRELKDGQGGDIVQFGYGPVTRLLLEHGLLDELRLWVHPLILGRGTPADLLFGPVPGVGFELADTTALSNGIVILTYRTDGRLAEAA